MTKIFDLVMGKALTILSIGDYAPIRYEYRMEVWAAIEEYLYTDGVRITRFKSRMSKAMVTAFDAAFRMGYKDGGGDPDQMEPDEISWYVSKQNGEIGYIDSLFQQLKELKGEAKEDATVLEGVADRRADGYAKTLDGVYSEGKIRGSKNKMLTFGGTDGEESCPTCQRMKGQRHKASWWVKHGLTLFRGNENYECGVYNCQHYLFDDMGNVWTA